MKDAALQNASQPRPLLEHRRSMVAYGREIVIGLVIGVASLVGFGVLFLPPFELSPWEIAWIALCGATLGTIALMLAGAHLRAAGEFHCRLDEQRFHCFSPVEASGDSFDLAIDEIAKIEREDWADDCRWYVWDSNGNRHWVSSNYDNPAQKFIEMLERLRPRIERIKT